MLFTVPCTPLPCRIAFVEFKETESMTKALEMNGSELKGQVLVVNEAGQPPPRGGFGRTADGEGTGNSTDAGTYGTWGSGG
jgi:RNA recognition motif-containing protein